MDKQITEQQAEDIRESIVRKQREYGKHLTSHDNMLLDLLSRLERGEKIYFSKEADAGTWFAGLENFAVWED